jgi:hypothetical protein
MSPASAVALLTVAPHPAGAPGVDCSTAPPVLSQLCDAAGSVGTAVSGAAGAVAGSFGDAAVHAVTQWVIGGAVWFLDQVASAVTSTTQVNTTATFFTTHYAVMAAIAATVALPLLLASVIGGAIHGDVSRLGRAVAMTFAAGLGTFAAVTITGLLLAVTDDLSARISAGMGADLNQSLHGVGTVLQQTGQLTSVGTDGTAVPLFAGFLAAVVIVISALGVWIELVLREVAIYGALLFFPLALAGLVWDATARWARRLAEIIVSLILAKLVIVALLSLGMAGVASGNFNDVIAGGAMMLLAMFSPWAVMRIVGVGEIALAGGGLAGMRGSAMSAGGHRAAQAGNAARSVIATKTGSAGTGAAAAGGSSEGLTVAAAGGSAAAGPAGVAAAGVIAAGKAAAHQARSKAHDTVWTTTAAIDATSTHGSTPSRGAEAPAALSQVEGRLADAHD